MKKRRDGGALTQREAAEFRRLERGRRERDLRNLLARCPQNIVLTLLDSSRKMMGAWHEAGLPRPADPGAYNLFEVIPWLKCRWLQEGRAPTPEELEWVVRKQRAEALLKESDLDIRKSRLLPIEDVERGRVERIRVVTRGLEALTRSLPPRLEGKSIEEIGAELESAVRDLREGFAGTPAPPPEPPEPPPAPEGPGTKGAAEEFLRAALADGPVEAREVETQARKAGISGRTLRRAKLCLKVVSARASVAGRGRMGAWTWTLPPPGGHVAMWPPGAAPGGPNAASRGRRPGRSAARGRERGPGPGRGRASVGRRRRERVP